MSLRYYRAGDRLTEIHFADIPEIINTQRIENTFLFNPCTQAPSQAQIGRQDGTSLILLLEQVALDVERERSRQPNQHVVLTLTLDHAEVVGDQPRLDEVGIERLLTAIATIIGNNQGAIAIIGPGGELQGQLRRLLYNVPQVEICGFAAIEMCVNEAFSTVR